MKNEEKRKIIEMYQLVVKENNLNMVQLESLLNALYKALTMDLFKRVRKQLNNVINTILYALENDLITLNDYIEIQYTKNFVNRGIVVNQVLKKVIEWYQLNGIAMNSHLVDTNNPASIKKHTTNENALIVCDKGIYITKVYNANYHYDYTSDKNKKLVKKLTSLENGTNALIEWA